MELGRKWKIIFLSFAALIALSLVFTEALTAAEHDHDCIGEGCPVCLLLEAAECFLNTFRLAAIGLFLAAYSVFPSRIRKDYVEFIPCSLSPVSLKVRFNS